MIKYIYLLAGGALGTYLRYFVSGLSYKWFDWTFPVGTLVVNLAGSFFIGLLWGVFESLNMNPNIRIFLFVGLLGGFTTFSSFMLETLNLYRDGEIKLAVYNLLTNNIFGVVLVVAGFLLSKFILTTIK